MTAGNTLYFPHSPVIEGAHGAPEGDEVRDQMAVEFGIVLSVHAANEKHAWLVICRLLLLPSLEVGGRGGTAARDFVAAY